MTTAIQTRKPSLLPPKKQDKILALIDDKMAMPDDIDKVSWTLTSVARSVGVAPKTFIAKMHEALDDTKHRYRPLALKVWEKWAIREDILHRMAIESGLDRKDWKAFVTVLERTQDEWRPVRDNGSGGTINIGVVEKMAMLQQQQGALPQGD